MRSLRSIIDTWRKSGSLQSEKSEHLAGQVETFDAIIKGVAAGEAGDPAESTDPLAVLSERLDLLVADAGRWNEYKAASAEYIEEFAKEIRWHRRVRLAVAVFSGLLIVTLITCLVLAVLYREALFGTDVGHALTALIVAAIGGSVIIAIAVAKGAFATIADRNAGLPMPDHMKEVFDVGKNLWKS